MQMMPKNKGKCKAKETVRDGDQPERQSPFVEPTEPESIQYPPGQRLRLSLAE